MPMSRCLSSGVIQMPAGCLPVAIVQRISCFSRSMAMNSFDSCSVTKASLLSAENAMWLGTLPVGRRLASLKVPPW